MLILIGASASGKTEVAKLLSKKYQINKIITYTTRKPRINEINGVDYHFIDEEEFSKLIDQNFFIETTYYNSSYYGTAKKDILDNKCIILDPNGLKAFFNLHDPHIISVYLKSDETKRYQRMIQRQDSIENAKKRIINDRISFHRSNLKGIDFTINSDDKTIEQLSDAIYELYINQLRKVNHEDF